MATHAPITGALTCAPFDPADWLSRFESLGGGYAFTGETARLMIIVPNRTDEELSAARRMIGALRPYELRQVQDYICRKDGETAPVIGATRGHAADAAILDAWERRRAAYARYSALPPCDAPGCAMSPQEAAEWEIIETAEEAIRSAVARTPRGVAIQLWTSLAHNTGSNEADVAIERADLAYFDDLGDRADWNVRLAVAALRSLKAMEG